MSSTTGSQNLLTNVFRPAYRYEIPVGGTTAMFTPSLDVSNIDVLTANSVTAFTAAIGDENENVYVGSNAGNSYSNLQGCSNNTAVGFAAASFVSNVANSVYIGYNAGAGAADSSVNIAIGANAKGNGISNIYIGSNTGSLGTGSNNILIGHNLTGSNLSNTLLIGPTPTIYGNLSTRKVGIGRDPSYNMDISGDARISYRLGVGMAPGTAENVSNVPHAIDVSGYSYFKGGFGINADPADYTFNLNGSFRAADGFGAMILQQDGSGNSVLTCKPDTTDVSGRKFILNVVGDICATAFVVPGASFAGDVTASNVIATADVSGPTAHITNIYGTTVFGTDVSGTTARFGSLFAGTFNPASVTTATVSVANGSVSTPSITFSNDVSSGFYLPSASNVAFTTAGVERMRISNTHVGIGTAVPRSALDVSTNIRAGTPGNTTNTARLEVGGGYLGDGTASTNSYPTLAFQYGDSAGGYRHFVRTRHQAATTSISNALDFFTNNSATAAASTAPGTNNLLGLSITSGGVGVGLSNPAVALDVSGAIRSTTATSNSVGGVALSNTNITLAGTITGSTANTSNVIGGVVLSNNNVSNSGTSTASNFVGTATASNSIGGVTLSNTNITLAGTITGSTANTSNVIGGVVLSNNNMSNSGTTTTANLLASGYLRNALTPSQFDISGGNVSNSATHTASNFIGTASASNSIGGVILSNSNAIVGGFLRNALTPNQFDISGGRVRTAVGSVNNPALGFLATDISAGMYLAASNQLGIAVGGTARLLIDNSSIGVGIPGSTAKTSLFEIGGGYDSAGTAIARSFPALAFHFGDGLSGGYRHFIRSRHNAAIGNNGNALDIFTNNSTSPETSAGPGVGNLLAMSITSTGVGIGLSNPAAALDVSGVLRASNAGVVTNYVRNALIPSTYDISGGNISNSGTVSTANLLASGYLRNALTPSQFDISGGNISNSGVHTTTGLVGTYVRNALTASTYDISGGRFRGSAGAVSNPTYAFLTDPSAGLYLPSASNLGITIAGVERMRITSNGRVGIGTSNPQSLLDVSSSTSSDGVYITAPDAQLRVRDPSNAVGNHLAVYQSGVGQGFYTASTLPLHTWVNAAIRTTVDSNGRLGIGTSNPNGNLDVFGQGSTILVGATTSANGLLIQGYSNAGYIRPQLSGSVLYLGASNSNTVSISATGVGIGVTPPGYALDVAADATSNAAINMTTWPRISTSSNMTIVRGTLGIVGNTINWSNAQQNTISTSLMTLVLSNAAGCSFKINKSGVWSISWMLSVSNGYSSWIDASTNENSNVALNTTGTYIISRAQAESGTSSAGSWTGYLPSNANIFYKVRTDSAALTLNANSNYFMATFLCETSNAGGNFPFR